MMNLKFSIVVPIYNRESSIAEVIESVRMQNYDNWELILVDDGSNDHTGEICRSYVEKDRRIRYIYKENGGVCSARNIGIKRVTGDYLLFLDSDAMFMECTFSTLSATIEKFPQVEIICFGFKTKSKTWVPENISEAMLLERKEIRSKYLPTHINIKPQNENFLKDFVWNKCYKRCFISEHNLLFDEKRRTWEDGLFVVNCLDKAKTILLIPDVMHDDTHQEVEHLSVKFFKDQLKNYIEDEKNFKQRFEKEFDFESAYYCRHNFEVLNMLMNRTINTCGKKAKQYIEEVINEPILKWWCDRILSQSTFEKQIVDSIQNGHVNKICFLYKANIISRVTRKILMSVKLGVNVSAIN